MRTHQQPPPDLLFQATGSHPQFSVSGSLSGSLSLSILLSNLLPIAIAIPIPIAIPRGYDSHYLRWIRAHQQPPPDLLFQATDSHPQFSVSGSLSGSLSLSILLSNLRPIAIAIPRAIPRATHSHYLPRIRAHQQPPPDL